MRYSECDKILRATVLMVYMPPNLIDSPKLLWEVLLDERLVTVLI